MPAELERCVKAVLRDDPSKTEQQAYAICNAKLGKNGDEAKNDGWHGDSRRREGVMAVVGIQEYKYRDFDGVKTRKEFKSEAGLRYAAESFKREIPVFTNHDYTVQIGVVVDVKFDGERLIGVVRIDSGIDILLEKVYGSQIPVSIGFFYKPGDAGEYNGETYDVEQSEIMLDHLGVVTLGTPRCPTPTCSLGDAETTRNTSVMEDDGRIKATMESILTMEDDKEELEDDTAKNDVKATDAEEESAKPDLTVTADSNRGVSTKIIEDRDAVITRLDMERKELAELVRQQDAMLKCDRRKMILHLQDDRKMAKPFTVDELKEYNLQQLDMIARTVERVTRSGERTTRKETMGPPKEDSAEISADNNTVPIVKPNISGSGHIGIDIDYERLTKKYLDGDT